MYFNFYHGITHFALQLPHGKPPPDIRRENILLNYDYVPQRRNNHVTSHLRHHKH